MNLPLKLLRESLGEIGTNGVKVFGSRQMFDSGIESPEYSLHQILA